MVAILIGRNSHASCGFETPETPGRYETGSRRRGTDQMIDPQKDL
jgi:hypothetical protein